MPEHVASEKAIQDFYPDDFNRCYGCGQLNQDGLRIRSYPEGDDVVCSFTPQPYHMAAAGYVYGGLIASLIDCHGIATAAAATYQAEGRPPGSEPALRFVTASLHVDYVKPTPLGEALELRGRAEEVAARKVVVHVTLSARGEVRATGRVVAVRMPSGW